MIKFGFTEFNVYILVCTFVIELEDLPPFSSCPRSTVAYVTYL